MSCLVCDVVGKNTDAVPSPPSALTLIELAALLLLKRFLVEEPSTMFVLPTSTASSIIASLMPAPKLVDGFIDPTTLFERMRRLAAIDGVVAPDLPSFEFHPRWSRGERVAAFKDGSGNAVFIWSNAKGTVVRGFDHDVGVSPSLEGFPKALAGAIREPAFGGDEDLTFAWWQLAGDGRWYGTRAPRRVVEDLLGFAGSNAPRWLEHYYGEKIAAPVRAILEADALEMSAVRALASPKKPKPKKAKRATKKMRTRPSFGQASFVVQCEPTYVQMVIHDKAGRRARKRTRVYSRGCSGSCRRRRVAEGSPGKARRIFESVRS